MTPAEIRATRERLAMTKGQAARLCGVEARTWRHWEMGDRSVPGPIVRLLWLLERLPGVQRALEAAPQ